MFFLSSRGELADNQNVDAALPGLEKIISEGHAIDRWYDYIDTSAWANLHLNRETALQTTNELLQLINDKGIPQRWKQAAIQRYRLYNRVHPARDKVNVEILEEALSKVAAPPDLEAGSSGPNV